MRTMKFIVVSQTNQTKHYFLLHIRDTSITSCRCLVHSHSTQYQHRTTDFARKQYVNACTKQLLTQFDVPFHTLCTMSMITSSGTTAFLCAFYLIWAFPFFKPHPFLNWFISNLHNRLSSGGHLARNQAPFILSFTLQSSSPSPLFITFEPIFNIGFRKLFCSRIFFDFL